MKLYRTKHEPNDPSQYLNNGQDVSLSQFPASLQRPPNGLLSPALPRSLPSIPHFFTLLWDSFTPPESVFCDLWPPGSHPVPSHLGAASMSHTWLKISYQLPPLNFTCLAPHLVATSPPCSAFTPLWPAGLCVEPEVWDNVTVLPSLGLWGEVSHWAMGKRKTPPT